MNKIKLLIFIIAFCSCRENSHNNEFEKLNLVKTNFRINDSSYYNSPNDIIVNKDYVFLSDYNRSEILKLDKNLNYIESIGSYGTGPGEINGAASMLIMNDSIILQNDNNISYEFYYNKKNIKTLKLPPDLSSTSFGNSFLLRKNKLLFSGYYNSGSICMLNLLDNTYEIKGELYKFPDYNQERIRNSRHLLQLNNSYIVSVSDNIPIIEIYDSEMNIVKKFDYSNIGIVKHTLESIKLKKINSGLTYAKLVQDVCINENNIYLLLISRNNNLTECNKVLVININLDLSFKLKKSYSLREKWYSSIDVEDNFLYTYTITGESLEKYEL